MIWFFGRFNCEDPASSVRNFDRVAARLAKFPHRQSLRILPLQKSGTEGGPVPEVGGVSGGPGEGMGWRPCKTLLGRWALRLKNLNEWLTCAARLLE
jgi:hypothetical protein